MNTILAHILIWEVHPKPAINSITMKTKIIFVLFLIRNRAFLNYVSNFIYHSYQWKNMDQWKFFGLFSASSWISAAFWFIDTPEGTTYWKRISEKWQKYVSQLNK